MIQFEFEKSEKSIIKVIGVGGGGSNAVNYMFRHGIKGVDFIICNTDRQALEKSPIPNKMQLGKLSTKGLGAGSIPDVGREAALESIDDIRNELSDSTQMVFITAGLGGGTGTGAAPVIAKVAKELGILTVGIVTIPFTFEGKKRRSQAEAGLEEMKKYVDTLLVIGNDRLREIYGNLKMSEAFGHADDVLSSAARSIAEIISLHMHINVDFNDVKTVMKDSGVAVMGSAVSSGDKRAIEAVQKALNSPLLNDNDIRGARHVLLNVMSGSNDINMDEFGEITDFIQEAAGGTAELITGYGSDPSLGEQVSVTIIATGFKTGQKSGFETPAFKARNVMDLNAEPPTIPAAVSEINTEATSDETFVYKRVSEDTETLNTEGITETPVAAHTEIELEDMNIEMLDDAAVEASQEPIQNETLTREQQLLVAKERIKKLKEISLKIRTPQGLAEFEKQSAFERRQGQPENRTPSAESEVSRYTIDQQNGTLQIRPNNGFLHDHVD